MGGRLLGGDCHHVLIQVVAGDLTDREGVAALVHLRRLQGAVEVAEGRRVVGMATH